MKIRIKKTKAKQQHKHETTKCLTLFKILSQRAKKLMDEIKHADDDIDRYKLVFIDSNNETFNFNIFRMPLHFISAICNGEITFKKAEISQRNLDKKLEELKYNYEPKNVEERTNTGIRLLRHLEMILFRLSI